MLSKIIFFTILNSKSISFETGFYVVSSQSCSCSLALSCLARDLCLVQQHLWQRKQLIHLKQLMHLKIPRDMNQHRTHLTFEAVEYVLRLSRLRNVENNNIAERFAAGPAQDQDGESLVPTCSRSQTRWEASPHPHTPALSQQSSPSGCRQTGSWKPCDRGTPGCWA